MLSVAPSGAGLGGLLAFADIEDGGVDFASEFDAFDDAVVSEMDSVDSRGSTNLMVGPSAGVGDVSGVAGSEIADLSVGVEYGGRCTIWRRKHS